MKYYEINFDENNNIVVIVDGEIIEGDKIYDIFKEINELNITESKALLRNVYLSGDDFKLTIYKTALFESGNYIEYMPNILDNFTNSLNELNKKRLDKLSKQNRKKKFTLVSAGSLFLIMLALGSIKQNNKIDINGKDDLLKNKFDKEIELLLEALDEEYKAKHAYNEEKYIEQSTLRYQDMLEMKEREEKELESRTTYLEYVDKFGSFDAEYAYNEYYELIKECSKKWGISPNLILGILTQESHGLETNLTQIVFKSWNGERIKAYNFNENKWEHFVITDNPNAYKDEDITCITRKDLTDPKKNINTCCLIFRDYFEKMDYHIAATIMSYNIGFRKMYKMLDITAQNTGVSVEDILNDQTNVSFMDYNYIVEFADKDYLPHVLQFVGNPNFTIKIADENGNITEKSVCLESSIKKTR